MFPIEKILKREVEKQIAGFIDRNIDRMANLLCASLSEKPVELQLTVEAENIVIEYTEKILGLRSRKTLSMSSSHPAKRQFNTGLGHNGSGLEKINQAEVEVNLRTSGRLRGIDFSQSKFGLGIGIHSVRFELSAHGKLKY